MGASFLHRKIVPSFLLCIWCCHLIVAINIDGSAEGRTFYGIGGLSGGGATSRLLVSYEQKYRDEILDYLFTPNFGASLHLLKVEIGGDAQTTDGTEPSHMHTSTDLNFQRGYEWWLMQEAKKRNPNIKIYGLSWAVPGWIGNGNYFSLDNVDYHIKWLQGAKEYYDIEVDYIGIWNERAYANTKNFTFIKELRAAMDAQGFTYTKIVAADDGNWDIVHSLEQDPQLTKDVAIVGVHYPGTQSTSQAKALGKPLWASEDYSTFADLVGGGCWARILNENYVNGYMTSTIAWNLVAAYYPELPFGGDGLMWAQFPWTGHYQVQSPIWISAHTAQFSEPGWVYLKHGHGTGKLPLGGSYITLVPPLSPSSKRMHHSHRTKARPGAAARTVMEATREHGDFTMVIETMGHDGSVCIRPPLPPFNVSQQTVTFTLLGPLKKAKKLYVWYSKFGKTDATTTLFRQVESITPDHKGQFVMRLGVQEVWTLSTTTGQMKGHFEEQPPPIRPFSSLLPYTDDFESYPLYSEANYFADQTGSWEIHKSSSASHGRVMRQMVPEPPIVWCTESIRPITIIGDHALSNYQITADMMVESDSGMVSLGTRVGKGGCGNNYDQGYFLSVNTSGLWNVTAGTGNLLGSGKARFYPHQWHTLSLATKSNGRGGVDIIALLDDQLLFQYNEEKKTWANGWAAIGSGYHYSQFDNFNMTLII